MARIPQPFLFQWNELDELGDLERLRLVLDALPDEPLMQELEKTRGKGRNDYPIRAMWNALIAGVVFQHRSQAGLIRELKRNAQLRQLCGFDPLKGADAIPGPYVFSRFWVLLLNHRDTVERMFDGLVEGLCDVLPDFGSVTAADGKAVPTFARARKDQQDRKQDRRRDTDADWGKKVTRTRKADGSFSEKVFKWFGYKLHLIVDAKYELPVAFELTPASAGEQPQARRLYTELAEKHPRVIERGEFALADRGYDDTALIEQLWDEHGIKPVIGIRNCWKQPDGGETRVVSEQTNVTYDYQGNVFCTCLRTGEVRPMAYGGFEAARQSLKYRCPAVHYGMECKGRSQCPLKGSIRIALREDRRIFTPVARSSYKWKRLYKQRTAVERVNSRLDEVFGYEKHYIRGQEKMKLSLTLSFVVMLAMALGRIRENREKDMRSLVRAA